jgi:hypothetical protein
MIFVRQALYLARMNVIAKFLGATGPRFSLNIGDFRFLLIALLQGLKKLQKRNWESFPIDAAPF